MCIKKEPCILLPRRIITRSLKKIKTVRPIHLLHVFLADLKKSGKIILTCFCQKSEIMGKTYRIFFRNIPENEKHMNCPKCLRERCVSQPLLQSMVLKCFTWDQDDEQRNYILKSEDIFFYSQLFQFNMIITNSAALRNISTIFQNNTIQSLSCIKTFFNWSEQVKSFTKRGIFLYHFCVDGFSSLAALPQITIQWLF